jgi:hypothetical protein
LQNLIIKTILALAIPTIASAGMIDYTAVIEIKNGSTSLGYLVNDPAYWTPEITPDSASAFIVDFTLNGTSGSQANLLPDSPSQGFPYLGLTQGRDSTDSNIGSGNFNYLYIEGTNATDPGATPQLVGNYFNTGTGLSHTSESAIWSIDITGTTGTLTPQWINTDDSSPTTVTFVQSNHVYAGGDASAFNGRFPAGVTSVTLQLDILSATPETEAVPEPAALSTMALGVFVLGAEVLRRRQRAATSRL